MRYLIADEDEGVFLGTHYNPLLDDSKEGKKIYVIFARSDIFGLHKAASFDTEEDAVSYIEEYLSAGFEELKVLPVDVKEKYVDVVDIIKAGYGKYTHEMIDAIPMDSEEIH